MYLLFFKSQKRFVNLLFSSDFLRKILITFLVLFSSISLFAQSTGTLKINIVPSTALFKIDNQIYKASEQKELKLNEGTYIIEIWAPKMALITDTIQLKAYETLTYIKGMRETSTDYDSFAKKRRKYNIKNTVRYSTCALIVGANVFLSTELLDPTEKAEIEQIRQNALDSIEEYENAVTENAINESKANYEEFKAEYEERRDKYNQQKALKISGLSVGYLVSGFFIVKLLSKKYEKPVFNEKNPFARVNVRPEIGLNNSFTLNTSIKF